jgi:hypothetical protein
MDRKNFLKLSGILTAGATVLKPFESLAKQERVTHTEFKDSGEVLGNKEKVYFLEANGRVVGEFWPIHTLNLVSRDIDPQAFQGEIIDIQRKLKGVATTPDGMTSGSYGFQMEGKCLANGMPCGNGEIKDYGIISLDHNGARPVFTHTRAIENFDDYYNKIKQNRGTLFFLPSVYREGKFIDSTRVLDKVLIRRTTPNGDQIGVVIFNTAITYNQAREIILGLDRPGKSTTQNIYMLDGGPTWGQCIKEDINGNVSTIGTRDPAAVTNYLVFY